MKKVEFGTFLRHLVLLFWPHMLLDTFIRFFKL